MLGWAITLAYLVVAYFCWRAGASGRRDRLLWRILALALLLGGLNKQLDLQTLAIASGRQLLLGTSWFAERRQLELRFAQFLIVITAGAGVWLVIRLRRFQPISRVACLGVAMVSLCWLLRAAYFSHFTVSAWIARGSRTELIELAGLVVAGAAAGWRITRRRAR